MGMSLWTANEMAKEGKSYEEILSFFFEGSKRPKCYNETFRNQILRLFSQTTQSKKAFSYRVGISVGVLKKWLKEEALKAND